MHVANTLGAPLFDYTPRVRKEIWEYRPPASLDDHTAAHGWFSSPHDAAKRVPAMIMPPGLRTCALLAHVLCSVGWFGAVVSFLALAAVGLTSPDQHLVRATYLAMDVITSFAIVPLCLASLLTGLIQAIGTTWGVFRHYWILAKLAITIPSTIILLTHVPAIQYLAEMATDGTAANDNLDQLLLQLAMSAAAALLALLTTAALSIYKPRGLTPYGRRKQRDQPFGSSDSDAAT